MIAELLGLAHDKSTRWSRPSAVTVGADGGASGVVVALLDAAPGPEALVARIWKAWLALFTRPVTVKVVVVRLLLAMSAHRVKSVAAGVDVSPSSPARVLL